MSSPLVRRGDINETGGAIIGPCSSTVFANGQPVSLIGDMVSAHAPCNPRNPAHCAAFVTAGSGVVFSENQSVVHVGVSDSCGHSRLTGSPDVITGL